MINKKGKFLIFIAFIFFLVILSFFLKGYQKSSPIPVKIPQDNLASSLIKELKETNKELLYQNVEILKKNLDLLESNQKDSWQYLPNNNLKEESYRDFTEVSLNPKDLIHNRCKRVRPQLAIIIDDIAFMQQYHKVMQLPFKVTPSIFPKSKASPSTPNIAKVTPFYMVHLPLEALDFYQKDHDLLFSADTKEIIEKKIKSIKEDFPDLTYLNNHTGSKFTQNQTAMKFLLEALNQEGITFVDSRTIAKSVTRKYYQYHSKQSFNVCQNTPFLERDIFLDNERDVKKITDNLMKAVKIAKTKGYAIAIGHPHKETLLALQNASNYLEKSGIDLVYINELIVP